MKGNKLAVYTLLVNENALHNLDQLNLSIPLKIMRQLNVESEKNKASINAEIITRLMLTMINPQAFGLNPDIDTMGGKQLLASETKQ